MASSVCTMNTCSYYNDSCSVTADCIYVMSQAPKPIRDLLDKIATNLDGLLGELGQEMRAIADYWKVDLGIIVTLNFAYELRKVCYMFKIAYIIL